MTPRINILIRTHRPLSFRRCVQSIIADNYTNKSSEIYLDGLDGLGMVDRSQPFFYNLHCNPLLARISDGWFFFLDDDDTLIPGALSKIAEHLTDPDQPIICQMLREGKPKPADMYMDRKVISRGRIGMPCMILHSKWKDAYTFEAVEDADYRWIKAISEILKPKFVKIPVVDAGRRSHGK
jgi:hypothetical protein